VTHGELRLPGVGFLPRCRFPSEGHLSSVGLPLPHCPRASYSSFACGGFFIWREWEWILKILLPAIFLGEKPKFSWRGFVVGGMENAIEEVRGYGTETSWEAVGGCPAYDAAEGTPVVVEDGWYADDGNAEVHIDFAEDGEEAAREYVSGGDWGESEETTWVEVSVWRRAYYVTEEGEIDCVEVLRDTHSIDLEPSEPECSGGEHEWASPHEVLGGVRETPGVWGKGGGVVIREVCRHCGCYRVTDTWANGPGGSQGYEKVRYEECDEISTRWVEGD
jgi:hypothetical protein